MSRLRPLLSGQFLHLNNPYGAILYRQLVIFPFHIMGVDDKKSLFFAGADEGALAVLARDSPAVRCCFDAGITAYTFVPFLDNLDHAFLTTLYNLSEGRIFSAKGIVK